jgi:hypothetical protein
MSLSLCDLKSFSKGEVRNKSLYFLLLLIMGGSEMISTKSTRWHNNVPSLRAHLRPLLPAHREYN